MGTFADRDRNQAFVSANAVFGVNHQIAGGKRGQFSKKRVGGLPAFLATDEPVAQHVLFADQRDFGRNKAVIDRQHNHRNRIVDAERALPAFDFGQRRCLVFGKQTLQPVARADRITRDNCLTAGFEQCFQVIGYGFINVDLLRAFGCKIPASGNSKIDNAG